MYRAKAMIPIEISFLSMRVDNYDQGDNDTRLVGMLDSLEEKWDMVTVWLVDYQQKLAKGYNIGVKSKKFMLGDLILRKVMGSIKDWSVGKLAPNWDGPYRVIAIAGMGAYYLEDMEERSLPQPWNVFNLKKYYP